MSKPRKGSKRARRPARRASGHQGPGVPGPVRDISETLITFVQPLVPAPIAKDPDLFTMLLELGVTTWNAVVLDAWEPESISEVRAAMRALPRALRTGLLPLFEELVERKRRDFQDDNRLMSGLQVRWAADGEPRVRLEARLPRALRHG